MKGLRIVSGALLLGILLVLSLPVSGLVPVDEEKTMVPKTPQGDTVRMTWKFDYSEELTRSFRFRGELGATYKVDWGDGKTDTYEQSAAWMECNHTYSRSGIYDVLLFGVGTVGKK